MTEEGCFFVFLLCARKKKKEKKKEAVLVDYSYACCVCMTSSQIAMPYYLPTLPDILEYNVDSPDERLSK